MSGNGVLSIRLGRDAAEQKGASQMEYLSPHTTDFISEGYLCDLAAKYQAPFHSLLSTAFKKKTGD